MNDDPDFIVTAEIARATRLRYLHFSLAKAARLSIAHRTERIERQLGLALLDAEESPETLDAIRSLIDGASEVASITPHNQHYPSFQLDRADSSSSVRLREDVIRPN